MLPSLLEQFADTVWLSPSLCQVLPPCHHLGKTFLDHSVKKHSSPPTPDFLSFPLQHFASDTYVTPFTFLCCLDLEEELPQGRWVVCFPTPRAVPGGIAGAP